MKISKKRVKIIKDEFIELLEQHHGILNPVIKASSISKSTFYKWLDEDPEFEQRYKDVKEDAISFVESKLFDLIEANEKSAIYFFLKCKGGYVERQQIEQTVSYLEPLKINILPPQQTDNKKDTIDITPITKKINK